MGRRLVTATGETSGGESPPQREKVLGLGFTSAETGEQREKNDGRGFDGGGCQKGMEGIGDGGFLW